MEVYKGPRTKFVHFPDCGHGSRAVDAHLCGDLDAGIAGWAEVSFMIDTQGRPYELTVTRSTGNPKLNEVARNVVTEARFEPASLNGKPVEAGYQLKVVLNNNEAGTSRAFNDAYEKLTKAATAGDRAAADAAMQRLKITNLYEDAYFGMATYFYARKWGDETQQLEGLQRAIAEDDQAHFLPGDLFKWALQVSLQLQVKQALYAEALDTYQKLQKLGMDKATSARLEPLVAQLQKIRGDDSSYAVSGTMPEGSWNLHLFKRHFQAEVSEGYLSQVKLRCEKNYVFFTFDPNLQYQIASKDGDCHMELIGAPGTKFKLFQF